MPQTLSIELVVDSSGAIQGIRTFDTAAKLAANGGTRSLNDILGAIEKNTARAGASGKDLDEIGKHSLSNLDQVRLLRDDLDVRIPRAMEKVISKSPQMMMAIKGVGTALLGIGALDIGIHIFEGVITGAREAMGELSGLTDGVRKYRDELQATNYIKLGNPVTLPDSQTNYDLLRKRRDTLEAKQRDHYSYGTMGIGVDLEAARAFVTNGQFDLFSKDNQTELDQTRSALDSSVPAGQKMRQDSAAEDVRNLKEKSDAAHALDGALRGAAAAQASYNKAVADAKFDKDDAMAKISGTKKATDPDTLRHINDKYDADMLRARNEYTAASINLSRQEREARVQAEDEATNAGLRGLKLLEAQRDQAIAKARRNDEGYSAGTVAAEVAAAQARYDAERQKRLEEQTAEMDRQVNEAKLLGLTGGAKILGERDLKIHNISADQALGKIDSPDVAQREREAAEAGANEQLLELRKSFSEQMDAISAESADRNLSVYERINAAAARQIASIRRDFEREFGQMPVSDPTRMAGQQSMDVAVTSVTTSAARQEAEERRKQLDETNDLVQEANAKLLGGERAATAQIVAEYEARTRKYKQELDQQLIDDDQYNQRMTAAAKTRDADIEKNAEEVRDRMAGALTSMFNDPGKFFAQRGQEFAMQILANNVMSLGGGANGKGTSVLNQVLGVGDKNTSTGFGVLFGRHGHGGGAEDHTAGLTHLDTAAQATSSALLQAASAASRFAGLMGGSTAGGGVTIAGGVTSASAGGSGAMAGLPYGVSAPGSAAMWDDVQTLGGMGSGGGSGVSIGNSVTEGGDPAAPGSAAMWNNVRSLGGTPMSPSAYSQVDGAFSTGTTMLSDANKLDKLGGGNGIKMPSWLGGSNDPDAGSWAAGGGAIGAAGDALGIYGATQAKSKIGGMMEGTMSGAELGAMVAGPAGALVGAGVGMVAGAFADAGRSQAEHYDHTTVRPGIAGLDEQYDAGGTSYMDAYSQLDSMRTQAADATNKMGSGAQSYYQSTIKREFEDAQAQLSKEEKAGRSDYGFSAAEFHIGGRVRNFYDMQTSATEGFAHLEMGEHVVSAAAAARHRPVLDAMNAGASSSDIAAAYLNAGRSSYGGGNNTVHHNYNGNINAIDAKSFDRFATENAKSIRKALNHSRGQYGGDWQ